MMLNACPSADALQRYAIGALSEAEAQTVNAHLGQCTLCLSRLDELAQEPHSVVAALRRPQPPTADANPALAGAVAAVLHGSKPGAGASPPESPTGTVLGGYRILEEVGRGGMGRVFRAVHPRLDQEVALKVLGPGMDSAPILARFEAERQALALMDHPSIARVSDGGVTEDGRPFFVMELVRGVTITHYCDQHRLDLRRRLGLFIDVCQAVQHAHQKGIIHRDLKPSNVLVAEYDARPVPKVIDFGVARAIDRRTGVETEVGMVVGTPDYMSPEQANLRSHDIDTRSDIYSLGALLYELLTGAPPLKPEPDTPILERLRVIREEAPPAPSTRLSSAARLGAERKTLARQVRGELDWIALKCLEKDRSRRYETAAALAEDVRRFLNDEPVQARPPSRAYRVRKFVRRNTGAVLAVTLLLLALVGGIVGTTWQALRATDSEQVARERLVAVEAANASTARALAESEAARKQAQAVADVMESLFRGIDPFALDEGQDLRGQLLAQLDEAEGRLAREQAADPVAWSRLAGALGVARLNLGQPARAVALLEKIHHEHESRLGRDHPGTLLPRHYYARALHEAGRTVESRTLHEENWKLAAARLGSDDPEIILFRSDLALVREDEGRLAEAIQLYQENLRLSERKLGGRHRLTLSVRNRLAKAYLAAGLAREALTLSQETLRQVEALFGRDHANTITPRNSVVVAYQGLGEWDRAIDLGEKTLALSLAKLGTGHLTTIDARNNLAVALRESGRLADAIRLQEENLKVAEAHLGNDHYKTLTVRINLALAFQEGNRAADALRLHKENVKHAEVQFGRDHLNTLTARHNFAMTLRGQKRFADAHRLNEDNLKVGEANYGRDHPDVLRFRNNLAFSCLDLGRKEEAVRLFEDNARLTEAKLGPDNPYTLRSQLNLIDAYLAAGQVASAIQQLKATRKLCMAKLGPGHADTRRIQGQLIQLYDSQGRLEEQEVLLREILLARPKEADCTYAADLLVSLGFNLVRRLKFADAEAPLRECLAIREKKEPHLLKTAIAQALLGRSLLGQKKYVAAEPLLLKGYQGLKQQEARLPGRGKARLVEALAALVQLYEALDNQAEAARWRRELDARKP